MTVIDVGENFATAFKGQGTATNSTLGSEFANNSESGYVPTFTNVTSGVTNIASSATLLQVVFSNVPASVTLYVPVTIAADQTTTVAPVVTAGTLTLVTSPSNLTTASASTSSSAPEPRH